MLSLLSPLFLLSFPFFSLLFPLPPLSLPPLPSPPPSPFYAGNSIIVRNQSDREAPWEKFHGIVDGLLDGIAEPGNTKRDRE